MVNKVKKKFLLVDYQVSLLRKMQNLRQKDMTVKEYTDKFYRLDIRSRHVDDDIEKIARYINGLRYGIQDEISFMKLESVEEAYQYALKYEEILQRIMNKDKEVEVVDSRGAEVDLMEKVADLTILCKIKENLNGRMMKKTRPSGKVVFLTKEEVILILEVVYVVIVSDVAKKCIDLLNVDLLKVGRIIEMV